LASCLGGGGGGGAARFASGRIGGAVAGATGLDCVTGGASLSCPAGCTLACGCKGWAGLVSPGFAGTGLTVFAGLAVVVACSRTFGCPVAGVVVWGSSFELAGSNAPGFAPPGPVVAVAAPLLISLLLPV